MLPFIWLTGHSSVTAPPYNANGQYTVPVVLFAFLIGIVCCAFRLRFQLSTLYSNYPQR